MKKILIIYFLLYSIQLLSQDNYYYYNNQKIPLEINSNLIYVTSSVDLDMQKISSLSNFDIRLNNKFPVNDKKQINSHQQILKIDQSTVSKTAYQTALSTLQNIEYITHVEPVIGYDAPRAVSEFCYVKLKNKADLIILKEQASKIGFDIVRTIQYMPMWYVLRSTQKGLSTLNISNRLYETGLFDKIDPGFIFEFSSNCITDDEFADQWGMQNLANQDIDINVCGAWNFNFGAGVTVAVVDGGIDATHDEFNNNLSPISFDAGSGTSPGVFYVNHGTHVAGIIGANQNGSQVSGVAPEATLMNISHPGSSPTFSEEMANGISFAVNNGADIINNSWSDNGVGNLQSTLLEDAILNALQNGRNGLGTIMVFTSGNNGVGQTNYPGNFTPEILCVGAIDQNGNRGNLSNFGNELDVVAPGVGILSTIQNNGTGLMSGTSQAAPHVSGLAALILSFRPCLTGEQVRDIIENSCHKLSSFNFSPTTGRPNGTWNNEVGYGLINAHAALQRARNIFLQNRTETNDINHFSLGNILAGSNVDPNISLTQGDYMVNSGTEVDLKADGFIDLLPNVDIATGSVFTARIDDFNGNCATWNSSLIKPTKPDEAVDLTVNNHSKQATLPIETSQYNLDWVVYPNPFKDRLNIKLNPVEPTNYTLNLYSALGQLVFQKNGSLYQGEQNLSIDTNELTNGVYLLQLHINGKILTKKIIHYEN